MDNYVIFYECKISHLKKQKKHINICETCNLNHAKHDVWLGTQHGKYNQIINVSSFTPNIAFPNGTALSGVLSVSGDEGMQPPQGAVVRPDQGADDHPLPSPNLHPPLATARPREHLLHLPPRPGHALHHLGAGGEAEHVEGDVEGQVGSIRARERRHRARPRV